MNKRLWIYIGVLGFTAITYNSIARVSAVEPPPAPPIYERSIVFQGGGFSTAVALGMLEGVRSKGYYPDLIIGTCGGAIAASIAQVLPDSEDQKKFLESHLVHEELKSIHLSKDKHLFRAIGLLEKVMTAGLWKTIPDFFSDYIINVPAELPLQEIQKPFQVGSATTPAVVIVAAQMQFGPDSQGQKFVRGGSYKETYFTDPGTAQLISNFPSPIGQQYSRSYVSPSTEVITDTTLSLAARASITDNYLMRPSELEGHYYMTGGIDLFPIELARLLSRETAMPFGEALSNPVFETEFSIAFGFSDIDRLKHVTSQFADYWIDSTDQIEALSSEDLNPGLNLSKGVLVEGVPEDYDKYVKDVEAMWNYGFERGAESIRASKNDKTHVRNKTKYNWSGN